jgi:ribonuclease Z
VEALARNAEVLIHEATTPGPFPSHTSPRQAGEVARRANVRRLVLVHFSPRWTLPEADALAEVRAGGFAGPAEIGRDGQVLTIGRGDDPVP